MPLYLWFITFLPGPCLRCCCFRGALADLYAAVHLDIYLPTLLKLLIVYVLFYLHYLWKRLLHTHAKFCTVAPLYLRRVFSRTQLHMHFIAPYDCMHSPYISRVPLHFFASTLVLPSHLNFLFLSSRNLSHSCCDVTLVGHHYSILFQIGHVLTYNWDIPTPRLAIFSALPHYAFPDYQPYLPVPLR